MHHVRWRVNVKKSVSMTLFWYNLTKISLKNTLYYCSFYILQNTMGKATAVLFAVLLLAVIIQVHTQNIDEGGSVYSFPHTHSPALQSRRWQVEAETRCPCRDISAGLLSWRQLCLRRKTNARTRHNQQRKSEENNIRISLLHSGIILCSQTTSDKMAVMAVNGRLKKNKQLVR